MSATWSGWWYRTATPPSTLSTGITAFAATGWPTSGRSKRAALRRNPRLAPHRHLTPDPHARDDEDGKAERHGVDRLAEQQGRGRDGEEGLPELHLDQPPHAAQRKIGRAAGREKGCQYA